MSRVKLQEQLARYGAARMAGLDPEHTKEWETELKRSAGWGGGGN